MCQPNQMKSHCPVFKYWIRLFFGLFARTRPKVFSTPKMIKIYPKTRLLYFYNTCIGKECVSQYRWLHSVREIPAFPIVFEAWKTCSISSGLLWSHEWPYCEKFQKSWTALLRAGLKWRTKRSMGWCSQWGSGLGSHGLGAHMSGGIVKGQ